MSRARPRSWLTTTPARTGTSRARTTCSAPSSSTAPSTRSTPPGWLKRCSRRSRSLSGQTHRRMRGASSDPLLWAIGLVAAVLLFGSLAERSLWQDEAETALLAKNILSFGKPVAFDGRNVVSQEAGKEFGPDRLWRWSPWLQYGIAALSIGLLGPTTLAARLPFAILGLLCVPLVYLVARRLFASVAIARLSALFLALSVPFILHARQARWYALIDVSLLGLLLSVAGMA